MSVFQLFGRVHLSVLHIYIYIFIDTNIKLNYKHYLRIKLHIYTFHNVYKVLGRILISMDPPQKKKPSMTVFIVYIGTYAQQTIIIKINK